MANQECNPTDRDLIRPPIPPESYSAFWRLPAGLLLGLLATIGLARPLFQLLHADNTAQLWVPALNAVLAYLFLWILGMSGQLIQRRKLPVHTGPRLLRLFAWVIALVPLAGLLTGYALAHPTHAAAQLAAHIALFFALLQLAKQWTRAN
jgi:hypothetical protein